MKKNVIDVGKSLKKYIIEDISSIYYSVEKSVSFEFLKKSIAYNCRNDKGLDRLYKMAIKMTFEYPGARMTYLRNSLTFWYKQYKKDKK